MRPVDSSAARSGTKSIMGTTAMSWKISIPRAVPPWGGIHLIPFLENFEDHRRTAEGDEEASENRFVEGKTDLDPYEGRGEEGDGYLEGASHQGGPFDPEKLIEGELDSDSEEEEYHPHLGEDLDLLHLLDEPKAVGPRHHPRRQEPHHHRDSEPVAGEDGDYRDEEDDDDVVEELNGHGHLSTFPQYRR
ncbi:MAG: hypothetical protein XE07_1266 [Methanothrix harundinacea]|uniref:Uncharacterized protein n=1 Tax=Methanothrix harundinacea TaxID=301375 RepID=A0A101IJX5_9EURY|nr:MAG: hypothetical protein XE07_1266 [Methanothrix harundinacea]